MISPVQPDLPADPDAPMAPPPKPVLPMMLGFICVVMLVAYPIRFFELTFPEPGPGGFSAVPLPLRLANLAIFTVQAFLLVALLGMRRWAVWGYSAAALAYLAFTLSVGGVWQKIIPDLLVLGNAWAYYYRMK